MDMRTSIWYRTEERLPDESGNYLTHGAFDMTYDILGVRRLGSHTSCISFLYYHKDTGKWYLREGEQHSMDSGIQTVYYWTDVDPKKWTEIDPPSTHIKKLKDNPALEIAWKNVEEAVGKYEFLKKLVE